MGREGLNLMNARFVLGQGGRRRLPVKDLRKVSVFRKHKDMSLALIVTAACEHSLVYMSLFS